ncbi:bifunctional UDP-sugar hydrolase/5'-nucleotidase [Desulfoluna sp.]|uniref:bifunctional metallophosphatase/5'-nucleotidase n=1 Tax=Desulfoluna sp. TaxID=2045199 RepID=UPI00260B9535|nr:bifunctional metallophosphatase/5'-nucleotidase [Desulfoluna sp.]
MIKRVLLFVLSGVVTVMIGCGGLVHDGTDFGRLDGFSLGVGHFNDSHACLEESSVTLVVEGTKIYAPVGGYARLAERALEMRADHENFLLLNAGDVFTGTLFFTRYKGAADLDLMETMQVDAMVPGNHEFDQGPGVLADFIDQATFPLIAANLDVSGDDRLAGKIAPYIIKTFHGVPVGLFGLACEETPRVSSPGETVEFNASIPSARAAVDALKAQGIKVIIALTHQGVAADLKLAQSVNDIDLIVGGHSHTLLGDYSAISLNASGLPYPLIEHSPDGHEVLIVQAWSKARVLGELTLMFDGEGRVTHYNGTSQVLLGRRILRKNAEGEKVPVDPSTRDAIVDVVAGIPGLVFVSEEGPVAARIGELSLPIDAMRAEVLAQVPETLWHTRVPGSVHVQAGVLATGSLIAPHVAEAMLYQAQEANMADVCIAIQNAGGVRTDLLRGDLTVGDAFSLLPFGNTLVTLSLTGDQIRRLLLEAAGLAVSSPTPGAFPYTAGLRYAWALKDETWEINEIEVFDKERWVTLVPESVYRVITNSYLAKGGDGYPDFTGMAGFYDTGFVDVDGFMAYARKMGTLSPLDMERN